MSQKQMRIGMSLRGHGYHLAAWRHPDVPADASVRLDHYIHTAQTAERGKCDLIFFADGLGIRERDVPRGALLDLLSQGRAGWNVVTSWSEAEALNFNRDSQLEYATRYARAREFVDVVKGLWDSWDTDAFLYDKTSGLFYDERKRHVLDHKGTYFAVRGRKRLVLSPEEEFALKHREGAGST